MSLDAAAAMDRLPWLPDEPQPSPAESAGNGLLPWVAVAAAVVAGASFWMGTPSLEEEPATPSRSTTTVRLPEPRNASIPQKRIDPEIVAAAGNVVGRGVTSAPNAASPKRAARRPRPHSTRARPAGRVVHVGAFGSSRQAERAWPAIVRANPAVANLRASVIPARNSRGRSYYRFQVGTTSQAHSEILCQRIRKAGLSCAVVEPRRKARSSGD
jgi:hypothetical protein